MRSKRGSKNYLIRVNGNTYQTSSIRRFLRHVRTIKSGKWHPLYLRVSYGKKENNLGEMVTFYNDADIYTAGEFSRTLEAFLEE